MILSFCSFCLSTHTVPGDRYSITGHLGTGTAFFYHLAQFHFFDCLKMSNSSEHFQELLDEVEAGNSKFIKPHIVKDILQWLVRFAASVEELAADLEGIDLDEDAESVASESVDSAGQESKDCSGVDELTDDHLEELEAASALLLTKLSSAKSKVSQLPTPTSEQVAQSELSSLMARAIATPRALRTPQQVALLREYHPLGVHTGESR